MKKTERRMLKAKRRMLKAIDQWLFKTEMLNAKRGTHRGRGNLSGVAQNGNAERYTLNAERIGLMAIGQELLKKETPKYYRLILMSKSLRN